MFESNTNLISARRRQVATRGLRQLKPDQRAEEIFLVQHRLQRLVRASGTKIDMGPARKVNRDIEPWLEIELIAG